MEPTPGLEPGTPSLRVVVGVEIRGRSGPAQSKKRLHAAHIAEDCSTPEWTRMDVAMYAESTRAKTARMTPT
jgi:hypothetical protein